MALTKFNYNSFDLTSAASKGLGFNASANGFSNVTEGSITLIKTLTASSSSDLTFEDGSSGVVLDSTYPTYMFKIVSLHVSDDAANLNLNFRDGGSSYDAVKTTSYMESYHSEDDSSTATQRNDGRNRGASTDVQVLGQNITNDNDGSVSGTVYLFNPGSTTFQKHFYSIINYYETNNKTENVFVSGYCDHASAIDGVKFTPSAGTFDAGSIKLYGIKDS